MEEKFNGRFSSLNKFFSCWIFSLFSYHKRVMYKGSKLPLIENDSKFNEWVDYFKKTWSNQLKTGNPNLSSILLNLSYKISSFSIFFMVFACFLLVFEFFLLYFIIQYLQEPEKTQNTMIFFICSLFAIVVFILLTWTGSIFQSSYASNQFKLILFEIILEKTLKIHNTVISKKSVRKKLKTLISKDTNISERIINIFFIIPAFIGFILCFTILTIIFGISGLLGIFVILLHAPLFWIDFKFDQSLRLKLRSASENRKMLLKSFINGIQKIKINLWEKPYTQIITQEFSITNTVQIQIYCLKSIIMVLKVSGFILSFCISFYFNWLYFELISTSQTFLLFLILFLCAIFFNFIIKGFTNLHEFYRLSQNIQDVLVLKEFHQIPDAIFPHSLLCLNKTNFAWDYVEPIVNVNQKGKLLIKKSRENFILNQISVKINKGELFIVIGDKKSGKTSFLMACLNEITMFTGKISIKGTIAYVPSKPWIFEGSVQENIILDSKFNEDLFKTVLKMCKLNKEIQKLPNDFKTIIGKNGFQLTWSQKTRICMARAIYSEPEIFLFDDLLENMEPELRKKIFQELKILAKQKIVVLTTNFTHLINQADKIMIFDNGNQVFYGTSFELFESDYADEILKAIVQSNSQKTIQKKIQNKTYKQGKYLKTEKNFFFLFSRHVLNYFQMFFFLLLMIIFIIFHQMTYFSLIYLLEILLSEESVSDWLYYFEICGIILIFIYLTHALQYFFILFIMIFIEQKVQKAIIKTIINIKYEYFCKISPKTLKKKLSLYINLIEKGMLVKFYRIITNLISTFFFSIIIFYFEPIAIISGLVWVILFCIIHTYFDPILQKVYQNEIKLNNSFYSEYKKLCKGLVTIRSFRKESHFFDKIKNSALSIKNLNLGFLSVLNIYHLIGYSLIGLIFFTFSISVLLNQNNLEITKSAYILIFSVILVKNSIFLHEDILKFKIQIKALKKLLNFSEIPCEINSNKEFKDFKGDIKFENVFIRYPQNFSEPILENVSFEIKCCSKVAILEKQITSKYAIIDLILGFLMPSSGTIFIDEIEHTLFSNNCIRQQISLISSKHIIFETTLRNNLDPLKNHNDTALLKILNDINLNFACENDDVLDTIIAGKDFNLNPTQNFLLGIGIALTKNSKIVIIDEQNQKIAVDINEIIEKYFKNCTTVIFTNNPNTITLCDNVICLENGSLVEFGSPFDLSNKKNSIFRKHISSNTPSKPILSKNLE